MDEKIDCDEIRLSKKAIERAEKITGDDTGAINSIESLIDSARDSVYFNWIKELCSGRIDEGELYYIISETCGGSHECYYMLTITWLVKNPKSKIKSFETYITGA